MAMNYKETTLLLLRLSLVFIFLWHGLPKVMNPTASASFFESLGLPGFSVLAIGLIEVAAGILLFLGLWYKWATYAIVAVMAGTMILVQIPGMISKGVGAGFERDLLILLASLVLAAHGPGHFSMHKRKK